MKDVSVVNEKPQIIIVIGPLALKLLRVEKIQVIVPMSTTQMIVI